LVYSKVNSLSQLQFLVKVLENKQKNVIQTLSRDANIFFGVEILGNSTRLTSDLEMFLTTEGFLLFFLTKYIYYNRGLSLFYFI
jgi:hypothetical protein